MLRRNDLAPYLIISVILHLGVAFLVFNGKEKPVFVSAPIEVSFYAPTEQRSDPTPVEAPEKPAVQQETVKEEPKTKEDVVVKAKEKPKKQQPKPQIPKKEEPKKVEEQKPATDVQTLQQGTQENRYAPAGAQFEGILFDSADFKYAYYTNQILKKIDREWRWSNNNSYSKIKARVYFMIHRDGSASDIKIRESSGNSEFDKYALDAVQRAVPFPPLPDGYNKDTLGVLFEFKNKY